MKFGGGCLRNAGDVGRICDIVLSRDEPVVLVVSALYGITDLLVGGIQDAQGGESGVPASMDRIRKRHMDILAGIMGDHPARAGAAEEIERRLQRLERLFYGVAYTEDASPAVRALILSHGERLAAQLVASALTRAGAPAVPMDSDRIGMHTDDNTDNATVAMDRARDELRASILPVVEKGSTPVVTGYFGRTPGGRISTFGRNGTDYSAAVLANALGASCLDIWKDVMGFMSADPALVPEARPVDTLSYYEAAELSYFGAKILHPRTVEPLVEPGIPVRVRDLHDPKGAGTLIQAGGYERDDVVKSVTYNRDVAVMRIHGPGVGHKPGIISMIGSRLSDRGVNIHSVITSQTCINLLISRGDARLSQAAVADMTGGVVERVEVEEDSALIGVVGEGLLRRKGLAARVFSAVARDEVNVEMISAGASEVAYYFIVRESDLPRAVRAVHRDFFQGGE